MKLLSRKGFTLAELLIAVFIFGLMITSLATIYSTANKHVFQNYRQNTIKSEALAAMKDITNNLMTANRIDCPCQPSSPSCPGGCPGTAANILAFAVNVDQVAGCRISDLASAPAPAWHYFCLNGSILYHHTSALTPAPPPCPSAPPDPCGTCWTAASYPVLTCGGPYGTAITQLSRVVSPPPGLGVLFSRRIGEGVYEEDQVKVMLRVFWDPTDPLKIASGIDLRTSARVIDSTITTTVKVNRSANLLLPP